mgnify:CR=1 FL=1
MRNFKVINIESLNEEYKGDKYRGELIQLVPIISNHYKLLEDTFRCIEHKKGSMKLINENHLLLLKEVW